MTEHLHPLVTAVLLLVLAAACAVDAVEHHRVWPLFVGWVLSLWAVALAVVWVVHLF